MSGDPRFSWASRGLNSQRERSTTQARRAELRGRIFRVLAVAGDAGLESGDLADEQVDRFREDARATAEHRRRSKPRPASTMRPCVVCKRLIKVRSVNGAGPRCAKHKAGAS